MLHILLLILKIIGIILAVIIGLILLALLCILFVPLRYCIKADGKLGEDEPFRAEVKISWLLHIVNAAFSYPHAAYVKVRIFIFTVMDTSKKEIAEAYSAISKDDAFDDEEYENKLEDWQSIESMKCSGEKDGSLNTGNEETSGEDNRKEEHLRADADKLAERLSEVFGEADSYKDLTIEEITEDSDAYTDKETERAVFLFLKNLWRAIKNIKYTICRMCDRIRKIISNIEYYVEVFQSDLFQAAFGVSKKQLMRIVRAVRPGKCRINLIAGTGDPASTGQILALYGMLYPFIGNNVFIQADFEEQRVEGDLYIKGKITIYRLLFAAFRVYSDKNIRQLIKMLKREDA